MTYVVGVRKGDVVSIHADSQLSANGKLLDVDSLKCGTLFAGCIFGLAGDWEDALRFVELSRRAVMHLPTMSEQWSMFEQVCSAYNSGNSQFQMLLATRVNGQPSFYLYHSEKRGLIAASGDFYTLGSGGPLYEKRVSKFVTHDFRDMAPAADFPYHLHALLNESLYGESKADADSHGVGGFFTFVMQDERGEMRQRPTLLVHLYADLATRSVIVHCHRLAFEDHPRIGEVMFYCEKPKGLPAEWHVLLQSISQDTIPDAEVRDIEAWADEVIARHRSNHPYYFLQAKVINVAYYTPFVDFSTDNIYYADLDDYLDPAVFDFLMHIHETGGPQAGSGWQMVKSPAFIGRKWPSGATPWPPG